MLLKKTEDFSGKEKTMASPNLLWLPTIPEMEREKSLEYKIKTRFMIVSVNWRIPSLFSTLLGKPTKILKNFGGYVMLMSI